MHRVKDGPANQSYGLQVAQLAGVPKVVIDQARNKLHSLEQDANQYVQAGGTLPLALNFAAEPDPKADELKTALQAIDPDDLTPKQALDALYNLHKLIK